MHLHRAVRAANHLGHGSDLALCPNVVPRHDVVDAKVRRGAVRQVAHHEAVWLAAVLVNHH